MGPDEHVHDIVDCEPCEQRMTEDLAIAGAAGGFVSDEEAARQRGHPVNPVSILRRTQADRDAADLPLPALAPAISTLPYPAVNGPPAQPAQPYFLNGQDYGYGPNVTVVDLGAVPAGPIEPTLMGPPGPGNPFAARRTQPVPVTYDTDNDLYRDPTPEAQQVSTEEIHATTDTHAHDTITTFPHLAGPFPSYFAAAPPDVEVPAEVTQYRAQVDRMRVQDEQRRRREADVEAATRSGHGGSGRRSGHGGSGSGSDSGRRSGHGGGSGAGSSSSSKPKRR